MQFLKANTAVDVLIGPFIDDTDGKTAETGLTLSQADILLSKNGQALTQKNDATAAAHDSGGYYNCEFDTTDVNTEGNLVLIVNESGALPVRHEYQVLSEAAWDSLFAAKDTGFMDINVKAVSEDTTAADNCEAFFDGTGYAGTNNVIPTVTTLTGHTAQTGDSYAIVNSGTHGNAALKSLIDTIDGIVDNILTDTGTTLDGKINTIDTVVDAIKAVTDLLPNAGALSDLATILADTNELQSDNIPATLATIAGYIDTEIAAILEDTGTTIPGLIAALDTVVDRIEADTQDLQTQIGTAGDGLSSLPNVTLANGAHGGAGASITLSSYSDFTGAAAANPNVLQDGTITVSTQTSFVLSAGSADDDAYNNMVIVLEDSATATQKSVRTITDYTGSSKTVTIDSGPDFTIANSDNFAILAVAPGSTPPTVGQIRTEMDSNSTQLAAIVADTNELQTDLANGGRLDLILDELTAQGDTNEGKLDTIDTVIDGIQTDLSNGTDGLGALKTLIDAVNTDLSNATDGLGALKTLIDTVDTVVDAIKAKTDNLPADPADDSDIDAQLATIAGYLDTEISAIKAKTDNLPTDPADQSEVEAAITAAHVTTDAMLTTIDNFLDTEVASILEDTGTTIPALLAALNDPAASAIADAVLDEVLADLSDNALNSGEDITPRKAIRGLFNRFFREVTQTATAQVVKNDSGTQVTTMAVSDDGTTQTKGIAT